MLGLSAAGQNTQGIRAESTPLSDTNSHSTDFFFPHLRFMHFAMRAFLILLPFCEEPIETLLLKNDSNTALHTSVLSMLHIFLFFYFVSTTYENVTQTYKELKEKLMGE